MSVPGVASATTRRRAHADPHAVGPGAGAYAQRRGVGARARAHLVDDRAQRDPEQRAVRLDRLRRGVELHRDLGRAQLREQVLQEDGLAPDLSAAERQERPRVVQGGEEGGGEPDVLLREPRRGVGAVADLPQPVPQRLDRPHEVLEAAERRRPGEGELERPLGGLHGAERRRQLEGDGQGTRDLGEVVDRLRARPRGVRPVVEDAQPLQPARGPEGHDEQRREAVAVALERVAEVEVLRGEGEGRLHSPHGALRARGAGPRGRRARGRSRSARSVAARGGWPACGTQKAACPAPAMRAMRASTGPSAASSGVPASSSCAATMVFRRSSRRWRATSRSSRSSVRAEPSWAEASA